jgi:hypothetical protein
LIKLRYELNVKNRFGHYFDFKDNNLFQEIRKLKYEEVVKNGTKIIEVKVNASAFVNVMDLSSKIVLSRMFVLSKEASNIESTKTVETLQIFPLSVF